MTTDELARQRYKRLLEQIRDELNGERGWMERASERLQVSSEYVSMIVSGRRRAGFDAITKAIDALHIAPEFFFGLPDSDPQYRDYVTRAAGRGDAKTPPYWHEFLERYQHLDQFSEEQLADIRGFAGRNMPIRSWTDWERIAEIVRTAKPSATFEAKASEDRRRNGH